MIYRVSRWNRHLSRSSGTLATYSEWFTVCLGEIAISLGRLVLLLLIQNGLQCVWSTVCLGEIAVSWSLLAIFLYIQTDLQCVSVKLPSPYLHWLPFYALDWSTVCLGEIAVSLSALVTTFLSIQTDPQCDSVKSASVYHQRHPCYTLKLVYSVSLRICTFYFFWIS